MKISYYILLAVTVVLSFRGYGQDIHFSQFDASLLNLSPGYTGFFDGDYRIGAVYRSQWSSVPVSYSTFGLNVEQRIKPRQLKKDMVGVGLMFNNDRAGDASYGTTQFYASGSYIFLAKPDSSLILTLGGNFGWSRTGFDYNKMTFDNQYDGFGYSRSLGSGEQFNTNNVNVIDFSIGTVIRYVIGGKHRFTYGFGWQHLTSPVVTFQSNTSNRLNYRFTNCLNYSVPLNEKCDIIAEGLFTRQGMYYEIIPHTSLKYYFDREDNIAVLGGLCLRARDALIVRLGYSNKTLQSGISYDINISRFNAASNLRGGFELFVNYIIKLKPGFVARKRYCPVFM